MPNLSPPAVQGSYQLYDNKPAGGEAAQQLWDALACKARGWGKRLVEDRGDPAPAGVAGPSSAGGGGFVSPGTAPAPACPSSPCTISQNPKEA